MSSMYMIVTCSIFALHISILSVLHMCIQFVCFSSLYIFTSSFILFFQLLIMFTYTKT